MEFIYAYELADSLAVSTILALLRTKMFIYIEIWSTAIVDSMMAVIKLFQMFFSVFKQSYGHSNYQILQQSCVRIELRGRWNWCIQ